MFLSHLLFCFWTFRVVICDVQSVSAVSLPPCHELSSDNDHSVPRCPSLLCHRLASPFASTSEWLFPGFSLCPLGRNYRKGEKRPRANSNTSVLSWRRIVGAMQTAVPFHDRPAGPSQSGSCSVSAFSPLLGGPPVYPGTAGTLPTHVALLSSSMSVLRCGTTTHFYNSSSTA